MIADRKNNPLAYRQGRRRRERLCFANQRKPRFVERRAAGASDNSAADEASLAVKVEDNQHIAFLAARPRVSRILLPALACQFASSTPRTRQPALACAAAAPQRRKPHRSRSGKATTASKC
jgi:hypothetical protein